MISKTLSELDEEFKTRGLKHMICSTETQWHHDTGVINMTIELVLIRKQSDTVNIENTEQLRFDNAMKSVFGE